MLANVLKNKNKTRITAPDHPEPVIYNQEKWGASCVQGKIMTRLKRYRRFLLFHPPGHIAALLCSQHNTISWQIISVNLDLSTLATRHPLNACLFPSWPDCLSWTIRKRPTLKVRLRSATLAPLMPVAPLAWRKHTCMTQTHVHSLIRACIGCPDMSTITSIGNGLVRDIQIFSVFMSDPVSEALLSDKGLFSPSCAVTDIVLAALRCFESWPVSKVASPQLLRSLGPNLRSLVLQDVAIVGEIPAEIGDVCPVLEILQLAQNPGITGKVPQSICKLHKLNKLLLFDTNLEPVGKYRFLQFLNRQEVALFQMELANCEKWS